MVLRPVWAEIDLSAIKYNVKAAKDKVGSDAEVMAVVKANGYGHGALEVARAALEAGAGWLGVAIPEEGIELREAGLSQPILVLAEPSVEAVTAVVENSLTTTVSSMRVAKALSAAAANLGVIARIHIKVDTGMNRIGLTPDQVPAFIRELRTLPAIDIEGIFTHFAEADNNCSSFTAVQLQSFKELLKTLQEQHMCPRIRHAANSAAVYMHPASHLDMVRIGISMYGLYPSEAMRSFVDLKPALELKAKLTRVKKITAGEGVSYSRTFRAHVDTDIGTVPIGYGDGYSRLLSNKVDVIFNGERHPQAGNICMDQFMVDLGAGSPANVDDEIVLIGAQGGERITVDELADILGTINYEIVCMIQARVPRVYL